MNIKNNGWFMVALLMAGCASSAPKPADCQGQFKPINDVSVNGSALDQPSSGKSLAGQSSKLHKVVRCDQGAVDGKYS